MPPSADVDFQDDCETLLALANLCDDPSGVPSAAVQRLTAMMRAAIRSEILSYGLPDSALNIDDVLQEAWRKALASLQKTRGEEVRQLRGWLVLVARCAARDMRSKAINKVRRAVELADPESSAPPIERFANAMYQSTPSAGIHRHEFLIQLYAFAGGLDEPDQTVMLLRLNGESPADIAKHTRLEPSLVKGTLLRLYRRIRCELLGVPAGGPR
jgi:RNA polymerase sigma factor (sigma-70 family)